MKCLRIKPVLKKKALLAGALVAGILGAVPAQATVTLTPTIAVIEGRERYADINLLNTSDKTETYTISWEFLKMPGENGEYEKIDKSITDFDMTQNVVFTPRRVTLEPRGMQKVRLGLRLKGEPPAPGDYRAHLLFMQDGRPKVAEGNEDELVKKGQIQMGVHVNVGFSVPVIYRVGESDVKPIIGNITTSIDPKTNRIKVTVPIDREGSNAYGVYGDLRIYYKGKIVGQIQNANIFPETPRRVFTTELTTNELSGGSLRIVYKHYDAANDTIYAEKTVPVGN